MTMGQTKNRKILIIVHNDDLRDTIEKIILEIYPEISMMSASNESYALFYALDFKPDYLIVSHDMNNSYDLLKRVKAVVKFIKGIIVYSPDSEDHERGLIKTIENDPGFSNIKAMRIDNLEESLQEFFS